MRIGPPLLECDTQVLQCLQRFFWAIPVRLDTTYTHAVQYNRLACKTTVVIFTLYLLICCMVHMLLRLLICCMVHGVA